jgi:hypothetical protein
MISTTTSPYFFGCELNFLLEQLSRICRNEAK